jgi:SAM-dependent methyltransferase
MFDISRSYWNDKDVEDKKDTFRLYMNENSEDVLSPHHLEAFNHSKELIENNGMRLRNVLSLACGTCWLESLLFKWRKFDSFTGVDFSDDRVQKMAKKTLKSSGISNFDLKVDDVYEFSTSKQFDLVIMCQAFHHMDSPVYLLKNIRKLLTQNGVVLIVGEHRFSLAEGIKRFVKHFGKLLLNYKGYRDTHYIFPGYSDLFGPSLEMGDNHYHLNHYQVMFARGGFEIIERIDRRGEASQSFLLRPIG